MDDICTRLFNWYEHNKRDLPWRHTNNPYHIWISEVILQQTRVAQGYDYYVNFIRNFPTVETLANAHEDEVLRCWQGLGYYSRARNLHAAAKHIVARGLFPNTYDEIIKLKGVGEYTAAAIASFAFNEPKAAVDGNVCRVWSRIFGINEPIDSNLGKRTIQEIAQTLLPTGKAALYNQAVMEFGALQCTPHAPNCLTCPLAEKCKALAENRVHELPIKTHKTKVSERFFTYLYIHDNSSLVIRKRTSNDIWKGLYEFPLIESSTPKDWEQLSSSTELGKWATLIPYTYKGVATRAIHILSHQKISASFIELEVGKLSTCPKGYTIIPTEQIADYAFPKLIVNFLENQKK